MEGCCGSTVKYLVFLSNLLVFVSKFEVILIAFFEGRNSRFEIWYCPYTFLVFEEKIKKKFKVFCRNFCTTSVCMMWFPPFLHLAGGPCLPRLRHLRPGHRRRQRPGLGQINLSHYPPPDSHLSSYPGWPYRESRPGPGIRLRRQQDSRSGPGEEAFFAYVKGRFVTRHRP